MLTMSMDEGVQGWETESDDESVPSRSCCLAPLLGRCICGACAPAQPSGAQEVMTLDGAPAAGFSENWFTSFDGARLGLDV